MARRRVKIVEAVKEVDLVQQVAPDSLHLGQHVYGRKVGRQYHGDLTPSRASS